jgi:hypothetical protein
MLQGQKISRESQVTVGGVPSDEVRADSAERYALSAPGRKHPTAVLLTVPVANPKMKAGPTQLFSVVSSRAQLLPQSCNAGRRRSKPECVAFALSLPSASCFCASGK